MQPVGPKVNGLLLLSGLSDASQRGKLAEDDRNGIERFIQKTFEAAEGQAVFYLDHGIYFATWSGKELTFHDDKEKKIEFLQLARIFNDKRELKIWRQNDGYYYRLRVDDAGAACEAVEAEQYLWGTTAEKANPGWTKLTEERGTELIVPLTIETGDGRPLARIKTRNYIGCLDQELGHSQATYVDCRFVKIVNN